MITAKLARAIANNKYHPSDKLAQSIVDAAKQGKTKLVVPSVSPDTINNLRQAGYDIEHDHQLTIIYW